MILETPGQIASDSGVMPGSVSFADEDVNIEKLFHGLACQAVVLERLRPNAFQHGPPTFTPAGQTSPYAGAPSGGLEPRGLSSLRDALKNDPAVAGF